MLQNMVLWRFKLQNWVLWRSVHEHSKSPPKASAAGTFTACRWGLGEVSLLNPPSPKPHFPHFPTSCDKVSSSQFLTSSDCLLFLTCLVCHLVWPTHARTVEYVFLLWDLTTWHDSKEDEKLVWDTRLANKRKQLHTHDATSTTRDVTRRLERLQRLSSGTQQKTEVAKSNVSHPFYSLVTHTHTKCIF